MKKRIGPVDESHSSISRTPGRLALCPKCGFQPKMLDLGDDPDIGPNRFRVGCPNENCNFQYGGYWNSTYKKAEDLWNESVLL